MPFNKKLKTIIAVYDRVVKEKLLRYVTDSGHTLIGCTQYSYDCATLCNRAVPDIIFCEETLFDTDIEMLIALLKARPLLSDVVFAVIVDTNVTAKKTTVHGADIILKYPFDSMTLERKLSDFYKSDVKRPFDNRLARNAAEALHKLGMSSDLRGYNCMLDALILVQGDAGLIKNASRTLYPRIAKLHGITSDYVDRLIRTAVHTSWKNCPKTVVKELFGNSIDGKFPTNNQYIATLSEYLRLKKD